MKCLNNLQHLPQAALRMLSYADLEVPGSTKTRIKQEGLDHESMAQ
ncbi:hypothetical protein [Stutzerimonas zhaodongensis]|nr:hypothetical protein [Stutzerimonas zhaodongensis]MCQ2031328.1 hypothetical protein [Stutzerimonas zhaodongensis]